MRELFQALNKVIAEKKDSVLVTVINSSGSTPRSSGAKMLLTKEGRVTGTIGGGAVEFRSEQLAQKVLKTKSTVLEKFILAPNEIADLGMICGGNVEIFFQYISWQDPIVAKICLEVEKHFNNHQQCWLISDINVTVSASLGFYSKETDFLGFTDATMNEQPLTKKASISEINGQKYYIEPLVAIGKVYVFGGGHVAQALIPVLKSLDFYCVVLDDRSQFLTEKLFPLADERLAVDLSNIAAAIQLTEDDYGIIMTRGHQFDFQLEEQLLRIKMRYIGVMGSKHKVAAHIKKLQESGFSTAKINQIHMPIGLEIKAETPAELAISVAGELILVRASEN